MSLHGPGSNGSITQNDLFSLERAYRPPSDPLDKPADPRVIFRDIPGAFALGWDNVSLTQALTSHVQGIFTASALLWDALLGDPRVQATLLARTQALFGRPVRHKPGKGPKADECYSAWRDVWPRVGRMNTLSEVMRWAVGMGFQHSEVAWDTSTDLWVPYLKPWLAQYEFYHLVSREYIAITYDGLTPITPGDGKWFGYSPHGSYRGWLHGAVRSVAIPWLTRQYAIRDFARFCEVHGIPIVKAFVPAVGSPEQKQRFTAGLRNLGSESVVMCPLGIDGQKYDLELLEAKDTSWQAFPAMLNTCDASIILPLLGQNLTTEVKEGSFAAAREHGDVKQSVLEGDNASIADEIYESLARPFAFFNYGDPDAAVYTDWVVEPAEDHFKNAQTLQAFATACQDLSHAGVEYDPGVLAEKMRIPGVPRQDTPQFVASKGMGGGAPGQSKAESVAMLLGACGIKVSPAAMNVINEMPDAIVEGFIVAKLEELKAMAGK